MRTLYSKKKKKTCQATVPYLNNGTNINREPTETGHSGRHGSANTHTCSLSLVVRASTENLALFPWVKLYIYTHVYTHTYLFAHYAYIIYISIYICTICIFIYNVNYILCINNVSHISLYYHYKITYIIISYNICYSIVYNYIT